jgi:hypothetical protein
MLRERPECSRQTVDVWVERSANYRRFDSYLVPQDAVPVITAGLKLPATADEWLAGRATELDRRLKRFSRRLLRGELEGVELRDGRLHVAPVKATATLETRIFADGIEAMMPPARIGDMAYQIAMDASEMVDRAPNGEARPGAFGSRVSRHDLIRR